MFDFFVVFCCSIDGGSCVFVEGCRDLFVMFVDGMVECLVMVGSFVVIVDVEVVGFFCDYDGMCYYFCCVGCGLVFDVDFVKYVVVVV